MQGLAAAGITTSRMACAGCGATAADDAFLPFVCPAARPGDGIDHVLWPQLDELDPSWAEFFSGGGDANPFVHYRSLFHVYHRARRAGLSDRAYLDQVEDLDRRIGAAEGREHGFRTTPYAHVEPLGVFVKNETAQAGGSHKARHLMSVALHLELMTLTEGEGAWSQAPLAIASCGNAALAAAVLARAMGRELQVFVPPWARTSVVEQLDQLGARRVVCERQAGSPPGDPCMHRYRQAVAGGALPFSVQGPENGLVLEGGQTLIWELLTQHAALGREPLTRVIVQVGGGALASSVIRGLILARRLGVIDELPRIDAVQPASAHPLKLAWDAARQVPIAEAARHRSSFMKPWPEEPKSLAYGILDDETYDWLAIVDGLKRSGGEVMLVTESQIAEAHSLGCSAAFPVCATGTAGLAGVLSLREDGAIGGDESVAVLFTGHEAPPS